MSQEINDKIKKCIALGDAFAQKEHTEHAIAEYKKGLEIDPNNTELICRIGLVYFNTGEIDKAIEEYQKAVLINPQDGDAHNFLGIAYYEKGLLSKAEEEYKIALQLQPYNPALYNNLGVIYTEQKRSDEAMVLYKKAIELNPQDATFHTNLGVIFYQQGLKKESESELLEALRLEPNEITAHYCLGIEFQHKGTLEVGQVLKIGQLLKIQPTHQMKLKDYSRIYTTRIEEVGEDTITVGAPIQRGVVIPLRPGQQLVAGISREDALYGFYTEVVERGKIGEIPVLKLRKSVSSKRIQRRKYVRIDGNVYIDFRILRRVGPEVNISHFDKRDVREKNISAGGVLVSSSQPLQRGTVLEINLTFADKSLIRTIGEVVRVIKTEEGTYDIGIAFVNLPEKDREKIIKYVYHRQLELRKMGL